MGMSKIASRTTFKVFTATGTGGQLTVASGAPVTIYGYSVYAGTSDAVFTITNADNDQVSIYAVKADESASIQICWKADNGFSIQTDSFAGGTSATVYHDSPGT